MNYLAQATDVNISGLTYPGQKILPTSQNMLGDLLSGKNAGFSVFAFVFFIAGVVLLYNLLYAAWDYTTSVGDAKKIAGATTRMVNAFLGITLVLGSFIIIRIALGVLGIQGF